ncbi:MAG: guanylyltransferase [Planctomycetes bacterium]|nr:guanylyltransferase [Planctomycetota bacterium]
MKFTELDRRMRVFETAHDHCVLPGIYMVARIDGRGFSRLTREVHHFKAPFDETFRDHMIETTKHLMDCGFRTLYGYTQSDEISLLFHRDEDAFGRKLRKFDSILAGEASACFSLRLGAPAAFDARICQLPDAGRVVDYFRWRHEDAHRNALNGHCYWQLRGEGQSAPEATKNLEGLSLPAKHELLFQRAQVNFNDLPAWQRRGVGITWEDFAKPSVDPRNGHAVSATRRRLHVDLELPMKDAYDTFIRGLLREGGAASADAAS